MNAPQIVLIALWAIGFGLTCAKHGQPKTGNENAWTSVVAIAIVAGILWWGGFWS